MQDRPSLMIPQLSADPSAPFPEPESALDTPDGLLAWGGDLDPRAGSIGAIYGVDPMAFSVHAEYINRPATVIVDPAGKVRFAYYGTYWGDRPSIKQTLEMVRAERFDFKHPKRRMAAPPK